MNRTWIYTGRMLPLVLAGALLASACAPDASGPLGPSTSSGISSDLLDDAAQVLPILQRTSPVEELSVTQVVGESGGVIQLGDGEVVVRIPAEALPSATEITLVRPAGTNVKYLFSLHGLPFAKSVTVEIDLAATAAEGDLSVLQSLVAVYFEDDHESHEVEVSELFLVQITLDGRAVFITSHFSGYCLAMD